MADFETKAVVAAFFVWVGGVLVSLSLAGALVYVAFHFIHKVW